MKWVKNFPNYKSEHTDIINEMTNSDDITPEWGDTLVGGTLHRILGMGRSALKNSEINGYVKKLDQLLGEILSKESGVDDKVEELKKDDVGSKVISSDGIEKSTEAFQEGDYEKSYGMLQNISTDGLSEFLKKIL